MTLNHAKCCSENKQGAGLENNEEEREGGATYEKGQGRPLSGDDI